MENQINIVSSRNKKIGLFLLIGPFAGVVLTLLAYTVVSFVTTSMGISSESTDLGRAIVNIIQLILSLIGLISVVGIVVGIPLGITYLNKKELAKDINYDERSGEKGASIVPDEIKGWNWGAIGLTWIWGVYHGVWISLLTFIPVVNIFIIIALGIKGNEWAWKAKKWESIEKFTSSQNKWKPWGIVFFILMVLGFISAFLNPEL
jgi:uncharacterized membrane protein